MYDKAPIKGTGRPGSTAESFGYGYDPTRNVDAPRAVEEKYLEENLRDVIPPDMDYGEVIKTYGSIEDANYYREKYKENVKEGMRGAGLDTRGPQSFLTGRF